MDVALVAGVPDDPVVRGVEGAVQGDGQLDHAEVGAEMAAGPGDGVDQELPDLAGQPGQLGGREGSQVRRGCDAGEQ